MTQPVQQQPEDRRRRRPALWLLLLGLALSLLLNLLLGRQLLGDDVAPATAQRLPTPASTPEVVVVDPAPASVITVESGTTDGAGDAGVASDLVVSGRVVGRVAPGTDASLVVSIANPFDTEVVVSAVTGSVTSVQPVGCLPSWFRVGRVTDPQALAANGRRTVVLPVVFLDSPTVNQDVCRGATYRFSIDVRARQE